MQDYSVRVEKQLPETLAHCDICGVKNEMRMVLISTYEEILLCPHCAHKVGFAADVIDSLNRREAERIMEDEYV